MERPGRNDACPCGSGKKYKRCCLGKEEARQAFSLQLERAALPLLRDLGRFASTRTRLAPEKVAAEHFPFWRPPLDQLHGARLLDFLIFDYATEPHGPTAAQEYLRERGPLLSEAARLLLTAWTETPTNMFVCEGWSGGFLVGLPLGGSSGQQAAEILPLEPGDRKAITAGAPIAARALPVAGASVYAAWPIAFGQRNPDDVLAAVQSRHHAYVRSERIVSWPEFLRLRPTVFDEESAVESGASRIIVPGR